jgi:Flp pilus assembly protein TadD
MWGIAVALLLLQTPDPAADGAKALEDGRYEAAAQAFTKAIAADPADYFSHFNLGMAYTLLRRDAEAAAEYRKTLELKPGLYEAESNLGILLMRGKQPAEALPHLEAAASQKPGEFRARYYQAEAELETGATAKAAGNFEAALKIDANSPEAHLGLGRALARQNQLAEAAPHFREAARLDAGFRDALLELAGLLERNRQTDEAVALYREFPANAAAQERLGALLLESKQYVEAAARLEAAWSKDPTEANRAALAQAYILNHQQDKAAPLLEQSVAANPDNFEIRMLYARLLRDRKDYPAAAAQFLAATKLKPAEPRPWTELTAMLHLMGDFPRALAALDRARELGEDSPGSWFIRAVLLDNLKQWKPALEAYQRFLSLSQGKNPDQEFQARQRARIVQRELEKR